MIHDRNIFSNSLNERLDGLTLYLPRCLVVTDLESGGKGASESDDREDEPDGEETDRASFEMRHEDGNASCAECGYTQSESSDAARHAELVSDARLAPWTFDIRVCHGDQPTDWTLRKMADLSDPFSCEHGHSLGMLRHTARVWGGVGEWRSATTTVCTLSSTVSLPK